MAELSIITAPDPRLKIKARPVAVVDDEIRRLMDDMLETMRKAIGIGLAAPQVGVAKRVIVLDVARQGEPPQPMMLANPEILWHSEELATFSEGCLSLPEHYADVTRPAQIRVRYLDYQNEIREIEASGLLATCIQHEMDHLDGVLFVDHISMVKRGMICASSPSQSAVVPRLPPSTPDAAPFTAATEDALNLIFMGTPPFAATILEALISAGHLLLAVYTQPPRPAGRGRRPQPSAVQRLAEEHELLVRVPARLRDETVQAEFAALGAEMTVVAASNLAPCLCLHSFIYTLPLTWAHNKGGSSLQPSPAHTPSVPARTSPHHLSTTPNIHHNTYTSSPHPALPSSPHQLCSPRPLPALPSVRLYTSQPDRPV